MAIQWKIKKFLTNDALLSFINENQISDFKIMDSYTDLGFLIVIYRYDPK